MPANLRYVIIKSLLVGSVWQTHCIPTLPLHGKIICLSESGETDTTVENALSLTTDQVKAKVMETYSESDLRHFLEKIPQFYNYKSTIFTDLDQKNAMKDDYISMKNQLQRIKDQIQSSTSESMSKTDLNQASKTIEKLEAFQEIIRNGIQDRIYKMKDKGSHITEIEFHWIGGESDSLKKKAKIAPTSSETAFSKGLGLDLVEKISQKVWDAQIEKLSGILNEIKLARDNDQKIIKKGNELFLDIQNLLFKQVGYMYKHKIISGEAVNKFFQSKITLETAALNMIHTIACSNNFNSLFPATLFNEWTAENYRNIYDALNENNKRYFSYILLKEFDYGSPNIGNFQLKSFFEEDKLFHTLENLIPHTSRNSYSMMNLKELRIHDPYYVKIKESVQELLSIFQDNEDDPIKSRNRDKSFFFLDFIETHYGLEILELEKGKKFEEKMNLMSSNFQLAGELKNIRWYMNGGDIPGKNILATKNNKNGEEILMIYKLSQDLISNHKNLFLDSEITHGRNFMIILLESFFNNLITQVIDQHKYYFLDYLPS